MGARSTTVGEAAHAADSLDGTWPRELEGEDTKLLDYVTAVLVDPDLHTDLRMRLHREITELLQGTHATVYGSAARGVQAAETRESRGEETRDGSIMGDDPQLAKLLRAMLVDPNLHTDMRMRLYDQIPNLVQRARQHAATGTERSD
jgi:hypothetical protein